jgi:surfeit locus 1 family protein
MLKRIALTLSRAKVISRRFIASYFDWKLSIQLSYLAFVCCAIVLCLLLSNWQWQRAQTSAERYAHYITLASAPLTPLSLASEQYQRVSMVGEIKQIFLLDNQIYKGNVGWYVLAVVQTKQLLILVNLGWQSKHSELIEIDQLANQIAVEGILKEPQTGFMLQAAKEDPKWPQVLQQIQISLLNKHYGYDLLPWVLYVNAPIANLIPAPSAIENKYPMHVGYAIQWLMLAVVCLSGFIFICRQENKENEHKKSS